MEKEYRELLQAYFDEPEKVASSNGPVLRSEFKLQLNDLGELYALSDTYFYRDIMQAIQNELARHE